VRQARYSLEMHVRRRKVWLSAGRVVELVALLIVWGCAATSAHRSDVSSLRGERSAEAAYSKQRQDPADTESATTPGEASARAEVGGTDDEAEPALAEPALPDSSKAPLSKQLGTASYYADALAGRRTASGEPYSIHRFTAAHRSLPFGTLVRVVNEASGRSVLVNINDRGPFRKGRIIDLSRAAAEKLAILKRGVAQVRVEVLRLGPAK